MSLTFNCTKRNGFTLVEVLITVTVLVIIFMAVLIGLNPMMQIFKGYDGRRKADLHSLKNAFEAYFADHDCYPSESVLDNCGSGDLEPYLKHIPCDPQDGTPYRLHLTPQGSVCPLEYAIYTKLLNPRDPLGSKYPQCPQTMAVTSTDISFVEVVAGCSNVSICPVYYGCRTGLCTAVARDRAPSCSPNYCDPDCGGVNCARQVRGRFVNECVARN